MNLFSKTWEAGRQGPVFRWHSLQVISVLLTSEDDDE